MSTAQISHLAEKTCIPCRGGMPPLRGRELDELAAELGNDWQVINQHHLEKEFSFKDFREALNFVNEVGEIAEAQNHHPDVLLQWGKAKITVWTHKIDGLTESDFIFAAKVDAIGK